jgi:hypothetical protein
MGRIKQTDSISFRESLLKDVNRTVRSQALRALIHIRK